MSGELISIILPVYNQAEHIAEIVHEYENTLAGVANPHELILVVNGDRDGSLAICQSLEAEYSGKVRVVHSQRGGWGLAVRLGLQQARGDIICYTNSARTSVQDLLLFVLYAIANPNTVIKANRKIRDNWRRRIGSLLYNIEVRTLFELACWDINGTPKIFPRKFDQLLQLTRDDDLIDAEFNAICQRAGYPMLEVPIFSTRRHGGKSTTNYNSALKMYVGAYELWKQMRDKAAYGK